MPVKLNYTKLWNFGGSNLQRLSSIARLKSLSPCISLCLQFLVTYKQATLWLLSKYITSILAHSMSILHEFDWPFFAFKRLSTYDSYHERQT
jgi:hypothetical protein